MRTIGFSTPTQTLHAELEIKDLNPFFWWTYHNLRRAEEAISQSKLNIKPENDSTPKTLTELI